MQDIFWLADFVLLSNRVPKKVSFTELSICRFATIIKSISPQLAAGSANAQFGKTQFFLRHPVKKTQNREIGIHKTSIFKTFRDSCCGELRGCTTPVLFLGKWVKKVYSILEV